MDVRKKHFDIGMDIHTESLQKGSINKEGRKYVKPS